MMKRGTVMAGILDGVRVVDVTDGIAGPMTTMLFADHGADVVRVERPDAAAPRAGDVVWQRGKRRVAFDPATPGGREALLDLATCADVLVESFRPAAAAAMGLEHEAFIAVNPRLVHTSITAYGRGTADADRPDIEWLVSARTGQQADQRGWYGTRMDHIMGVDLEEPGFDVPPGADQLGCREGPIFLAVPWAGIACAFLTTAATSAALRVAERTGTGQHVETSLAQAVINMNAMGWQRVATMHPSYRLWYFDRRAPKGVFRASDGWLHQWAPFEHTFLRANAAGVDPTTFEPVVIPWADYETSVRAQAEAFVPTAAAVATRPVDEWVRLGADAGIGLQPIRSAEEALFDEPLEREGVIVELDDPELGPIRQVGHVAGFDGVANPPIQPRAATTVDAAEIGWAPRRAVPTTPVPDAPLAGVVVLDFGLAIAGPFGAQVLADLGATVIKVTTLGFDLTDAIYVGSSRGKQALAVDLKHPRGQEIAARLIARADVVHHNMRTGVAERLGIGYEQARAINPAIIYCHTRGFERNGPRTHLPGNDQMGHALAGSAYEAGATHHGTAPIWQMCAYGDTGNGVMSAAAVVQALRHRDRTGEGQFVHTSILNVCMLFNSYTYAFPDGSGPARDRLDAEQYGFSDVQRLYETADGWLCLFVTDEAQRHALYDALGSDDVAATLALKDAQHWFDVLDAAGVPCEIASSTYARQLFDDPQMHERGWVATSEHADLGSMEHVAMPFSFSASARRNVAGAPVTGEHSRTVLAEVGYTDEEIDSLLADGVVRQHKSS